MSETMQTTIDWHYLPELPPEPETQGDIEHYLTAVDGGISEGWYEGNGEWTFWGGGDAFAWAEWPGAPRVRDAG